jgi:hypothetical protein
MVRARSMKTDMRKSQQVRARRASCFFFMGVQYLHGFKRFFGNGGGYQVML